MSDYQRQQHSTLVSVRLIVILGILSIFFCAWLWMSRQLPLFSKKQVVVTTRDLPPYTIIAAEDVTTTMTVNLLTDAFTMTNTTLGQITTSPLNRDTILTGDLLLSLPKDWLLFSVPYSSTLPLTSGKTVTLLGIKDDMDVAEIISQQAVMVGMMGQQAVVALPPDQIRRATTYLLPNRRLLVLHNL